MVLVSNLVSSGQVWKKDKTRWCFTSALVQGKAQSCVPCGLNMVVVNTTMSIIVMQLDCFPLSEIIMLNESLKL